MKKLNDTLRLKIYHIFSNLPVVSTKHIATLFNNAHPEKRASEAMVLLEKEKMIEGRRRSIGESKVWRLSKKGREFLNINKRPIPLTGQKIPHYLKIADIWFDVQKKGSLIRWNIELREEFKNGSKTLKYCPDIFMILKTNTSVKPYLIEVQTSPITSKRWEEKWIIYTLFKQSNQFEKASFQILRDKGKIIDPQIIVVSNQQPETIQTGLKQKLIITRNIKDTSL